MKETEYTVTKSTVESYKIRAKNSNLSWADINIDSNGNEGRIQIASDYGDWQNYWGACGCDFYKFLSQLDIHYFAGKVGTSKWFDLDSTIAYLNESIIEFSETLEQRETLLAELDDLMNCYNKDEFMHIISNCEGIMKMEDYSPDISYGIEPSFQRFWDELWPVFINEILTVKEKS